MSEPGVTNRILHLLLQDREAGRVRTIQEYQTLFPGSESLVAATLGEIEDSPAGPVLSDGSRFGRYQIVRFLGQGGQGTVHLARDEALDRLVALKVMSRVGVPSMEQLARFLREGRMASRLNHRALCTLLETGVAGGVPFIAMQYVEGETLACRIARARQSPSGADRLETTWVLTVFERLARGVHHLHESGIVHRDIKPSNVMITPEGDPVLLDFGLAAELESPSSLLSRTGDPFGTPAYMSPEQVRGSRADRRADIWALGVCLFEALTLEQPFDAPNRERLYEAIRNVDPPDIRQFGSRVSKDLKVVVECALAKEPDRRYATAAVMADDLRRVAVREPVKARPITAWDRAQRLIRRKPWQAAAALFLVLVLVGGSFLAARLPAIRAGDAAVAAAVLETRLRAGYLELGEGSSRRAVPVLEQAFRAAPQSAEAAAGLALGLLKEHRFEEALRLLDPGTELARRHPQLLRIRADALRFSGQAEAATALERTVPSASDRLGWFLFGIREIRLGHQGDHNAYVRAREALELACVGSALALPTFELAHALGHLELPEEARRLAAGIVCAWPDSAEAWHWAGFAELKTAPARAETAFREATRLDASSAVYWRRLGDALDAQKRHEEAVPMYVRARDLDPADVLAHLNLGHTMRRLGRIEETVACYEATLALDPRNSTALAMLACVHRDRGDDRTAERFARAAIAADDRYASAWESLGQALLRDRPEESIAAFDSALRCDPQLFIAHYHRGLALLQLDRGAEAEAEFRWCRAKDASHGDAINGLGCALLAQGKTTEARAALEECLSVDPRCTAAHLGLATIFGRVGQHEEAIDAIDKRLAHAPNDAIAIMNRANMLTMLSRLPEALDDYDRAIRAQPGLALARVNRGLLHFRMGRPNDAKRDIERAVELRPELPRAHGALMDMLQYLGDDAARGAEARRWARVRKNDPTAWRDAVLLALQSADSESRPGVDRAIELAREGVRMTGEKSPAVLYALALALSKAGDHAAALATCDTARAQLGENPADVELSDALSSLRDDLLERAGPTRGR